jgi:predicted acetyltransferase
MVDAMSSIYLLEPDKSHERVLLDYRSEFLANNEVMHGSGGADNFDTFDDWLKKTANDKSWDTVSEGRVPATQFLAFRKSDNKLVGMIQVRHELNDYLMNTGGHIGYSVRKSERRKGHATEMLQQALNYCRTIGITNVLVTCAKDNEGSAAVIRANGGVLENEFFDQEQNTVMLRFWISI